MTPRPSAAWTVTLRAEYVVLRLLDPFIRSMWFSVGIGITCLTGMVGALVRAGGTSEPADRLRGEHS